MKTIEQQNDHFDILIDILTSDNQQLRDFHVASNIANILSFIQIMNAISDKDEEASVEHLSNFITENTAVMYRAEALEEYEIAADIKKELNIMCGLVWRQNKKIYNTKVLKRDALKHLNDSIKNTRDYYYDLMESFQNQENEFNYDEDEDNY